MFTEYFLEDCIQMTQFVPPPSDRKRKDKDEEGGEEEVRKKHFRSFRSSKVCIFKYTSTPDDNFPMSRL